MRVERRWPPRSPAVSPRPPADRRGPRPGGGGRALVDQAGQALRLIPVPLAFEGRRTAPWWPAAVSSAALAYSRCGSERVAGSNSRARPRSGGASGGRPVEHLDQVWLPPPGGRHDLGRQPFEQAQRRQRGWQATSGEQLEARVGQQMPISITEVTALVRRRPAAPIVRRDRDHGVLLAAEADLVAGGRCSTGGRPQPEVTGRAPQPEAGSGASTSAPSNAVVSSVTSSRRHSMANSTGSTAIGSPTARGPSQQRGRLSERLP